MTGKINNETPTKCICHKGFSEYSSIVARSNIRVGGQGTTPQSLTAHTLDRYMISKHLLCFRFVLTGRFAIKQSN